jgi:tetrahydromethanopterin S-methyltransferase subunit E
MDFKEEKEKRSYKLGKNLGMAFSFFLFFSILYRMLSKLAVIKSAGYVSFMLGALFFCLILMFITRSRKWHGDF